MRKMYLNSLVANKRSAVAAFCLCLLFGVAAVFTSCSQSAQGDGTRCLTVSNPAMRFFVSRLAPADVSVNVMIPQGADHDSYTPRPTQMTSLANSMAYVAFGPLEFELTWRDRIEAAAPNIKWIDVSNGIELIASSECHHSTETDAMSQHVHSADPHFWLSPKQAALMSRNIADALKSLMPDDAKSIDSSLVALLADVSIADSALTKVASVNKGETFVIYHPALAYLARDYGFNQLSVGSEGVSPQPRRFAMLADSARRAKARVFFIQQGFAPDRVEASAAEMGTAVVHIQPESEDWLATMNTITEALK